MYRDVLTGKVDNLSIFSLLMILSKQFLLAQTDITLRICDMRVHVKMRKHKLFPKVPVTVC